LANRDPFLQILSNGWKVFLHSAMSFLVFSSFINIIRKNSAFTGLLMWNRDIAEGKVILDVDLWLIIENLVDNR
jgi:hypothetical protein